MKIHHWNYLSAAQIAHRLGKYQQAWYLLFLAEEAKDEQQKRGKDYESTPRQKEVQRLWQQRGMLERTKSNILQCAKLGHANSFNVAFVAVQQLIKQNIILTQSIKNRIPQ